MADDAPPPIEQGDARRLLRIYVNDHWAGAAGGTALARRLADQNRGTHWHPELAAIAAAIVEDERALAHVRRGLGCRWTPKRLAAAAGEAVARLKLNGRWRSYSPLSRVTEIEVLIGGVHAKQRLWRSLRHAGLPPDAAIDLGRLETRAEQQLDTLERLHESAADAAFSPARR